MRIRNKGLTEKPRSKCGIVKPMEEIAMYTRKLKSGKRVRYYRGWCKSCDNKVHGRTKEERRRHRLRQKYNITIEQYTEMYNSQEGNCKICGIHLDQLSIDHDHDTGAIRGLLCDGCNTGLGQFKDNIVYLQSAIKYIRESILAKMMQEDEKVELYEI